MKTKLIGLVSATAVACALAAPAFADGMTNWNFHTLLNDQGFTTNETVGSNHDTFTQGPDSILAVAVSQKGTTDSIDTDCLGSWCASTLDLWAKDAGSAGEQGLGLSGDSDGGGGEIFFPNGIYLNTANASGHVTDFMIGSVQGTANSGETWAVAGWTGSTWQWLGGGTGGGIVSLSGDFTGFDRFVVYDPSDVLVNNSNDIVLMSITTVPEPGTLALLGAGLLGCALFASRRRNSRQS